MLIQTVFRILKARVAVVLILCVFSINPVVAEPFFNQAEINQILSHGPWPPLSLPPDPGNELSGLEWAESIGEHLFSVTYLSGSGGLSCASCHQQELGFTDGRALAQGAAIHTRNTQGLWNVGLQRWFGWDGGADSQWSAAMRPLLSGIEMAGSIPEAASSLRQDPYFLQLLESANVEPATSDERLVVFATKCIAAYTRTLVSPKTAFDRYRDALETGDLVAQNAYSEAAKRGLKIFLGPANCRTCHFGPDFSNGEFHDTGRPFFTGVGQVDPGRYRGIQRVRQDRYNLIGDFSQPQHQEQILKTRNVTLGQSNWGQWRTPGLRQLLYTAPYTHDGSLATLHEVVDAYADIDPARLHGAGESILKPLDLGPSERTDLVRFLESLSE